jgi:hypothetical protein
VFGFSAQQLRALLTEYQEHYNTARPHQGIAQRIPDGDPHAFHGSAVDPQLPADPPKPVLNGLINEYLQAAGPEERCRSQPRILFSSGTRSANNRVFERYTTGSSVSCQAQEIGDMQRSHR